MRPYLTANAVSIANSGLKAKDEKSRRVIKPLNVGTKVYLDKEFLGLEAYCTQCRENRVFWVDRILEMKTVRE